MRLAELLETGSAALQRAGVESPLLDARLLLEYCSGKSRTALFLHPLDSVSDEVADRYLAAIARRQRREPLAYILGEREFWSRSFLVNPSVLIPRPETEFLLEQVLSRVDRENLRSGHLLDLCCGSGVIAVVLAIETGKAVVAVDISAEALAVAGENSRRHRVASQVHLLQADLLAPFAEREVFSLVVSNPPYVRSGELAAGLAPEVAFHEPHLALDGGADGLFLISRIRQALPAVLSPGGDFFLEFGAEQAEAVLTMFQAPSENGRDFCRLAVIQDYAGRDRVLHARMANE